MGDSNYPWSARSLAADPVSVTVPGLVGPLPSGVDLEGLISGNGSLLTEDEIHRLILENPGLVRPGSSNFDPITQVRCNTLTVR